MKLVIGLLVLAASSSVFANDRSSGCGMGYEIAPKQSLISSATRSLVNATFSNTVAMTMGTSGCAKHSIVYNEAKGIHFVEANKSQLALEMAQGQGEFVAGLANVMGCTNSAELGSMLQERYEVVLPSTETTGVELYNNVKAEIKNNANLSNTCSLI